MPTLVWAGKEHATKEANSVPYRLLERDESLCYGDATAGNIIVQGDNLAALKALMPYYRGRVRCIYIDPPYNTHSAFEHYDDSVEHSTWLSLMYPRLELLREMLSEDGSIWISIDDREYANLKCIGDEIFGLDCFVSNISWQRTYSTRNDSKGIVNEVEHILVYGKKPDWQPNKLPRTAEMDKIYKNPDNDVERWTSGDPCAAGGADHQGMVYAIQHPFTGKMLYPSRDAHWRYKQEDVLEIMCGWCEYELRDLNDADRRAEVCGISPDTVRQNVQGVVLSHPLEESKQKARAIYDRGQWPRFFFTKNGQGGIRRKTYLQNVGGKPPTNFWPYSEVGHTDEAKKEILALFNNKSPFATPKPERLIQRVIFLATNPGDLVLDSFLGSGTTAAVAQKMNRHYVGIEIGEHAVTHVVPRLRKVIDGEEGGISKAENWQGGGGFSFYRLGEEVFTADGQIRKDVKFQTLAAHLWMKATDTPYGSGQPKESDSVREIMSTYGHDSPLLGIHEGTAYYLLYNGILGDRRPDGGNVLTKKVLAVLPPHDGPRIIYGESSRLHEETLKAMDIVFRQIPKEIPAN